MYFETIKENFILQYRMMARISATIGEDLVGEIRRELQADSKIEAIVFDLQAWEFDYGAFRFFMPLGLELIKQKKQMYVLTQARSVISLIHAEGVSRILKPILSLSEIENGRSLIKFTPSKIDVAFINPFIEGTLHTLKIQCQTDFVPEKLVLKGREPSPFQTDIAGILGITSRTFTGSIAICFSEKVFLAIMTKMLGEECTEINQDLEDGAGEILNMIFGHAKKILNENGHSFEKALPTVVRATNLSVTHLSDQGSILLPFRSEIGPLHMEISTQSVVNKAI